MNVGNCTAPFGWREYLVSESQIFLSRSVACETDGNWWGTPKFVTSFTTGLRLVSYDVCLPCRR